MRKSSDIQSQVRSTADCAYECALRTALVLIYSVEDAHKYTDRLVLTADLNSVQSYDDGPF